MRVFGISGLSGTGKTTVMERLVKALRAKGYSVATVKSSKEDHSSPEGTDSWRHEQAGADPVVLLGPHSTSVRYATRRKIGDVLKEREIDFLLIEGLKEEPLPKVWCVGDTIVDPKGIPPTAVAVVVWMEPSPGLKSIKKPVLRIDDTERLLELVMKQAVDSSMLEL